MGRRGATGARRWWTAVVLGVLALFAADTASAADGQQTVSFTIVETRDIVVLTAGPDGAREVSWSGDGTRMTLEVSDTSEGELEVSSGGSSFSLSCGGGVALDTAATSLDLLPSGGQVEVTLRLSGV